MRLLINPYLLPIALVVSAYLLIGNGYRLEDLPYVGQYGIHLVWLGNLVAMVALLLTLGRTWKIVRAYQGKGEFCHRCGGPVSLKDGRYGPYSKCWACGTGRGERPF